MTSLDQIRARLEAATEYHPVPHRAVVNTAGDRHGVVDASGSVVTMDPPGAAHFYANAPTDVAFLLAELQKRDEAGQYALEINAEGYPRNVGPFPSQEDAETWMAGRKLTGSWNVFPLTCPT